MILGIVYPDTHKEEKEKWEKGKVEKRRTL